MRELQVIFMNYLEGAHTVLNPKEVRPTPYLTSQNGYKIVDEESGYMRLEKPSTVKVTVKYDNVKVHCEMLSKICAFYDQAKMSEELFTRFWKDILSGEVRLYLDDDDNVIIK